MDGLLGFSFPSLIDAVDPGTQNTGIGLSSRGMVMGLDGPDWGASGPAGAELRRRPGDG